MLSKEEKINLPEKYQNIENDYPFWRIQFYFEGTKNKTDQKEKYINYDRPITQCNDRIFQPR
jgi:hypothetical protein